VRSPAAQTNFNAFLMPPSMCTETLRCHEGPARSVVTGLRWRYKEACHLSIEGTRRRALRRCPSPCPLTVLRLATGDLLSVPLTNHRNSEAVQLAVING
jgi:hypothetical protein